MFFFNQNLIKKLYSPAALICLTALSAAIATVYPAQFKYYQAAKDTKTQATYKTILFFGNSLTAGYGVDAEQAFPNLIQQKMTKFGWPYKVINAGLSGETSSGGVRRIDWLLRQKIDILVLELGGNDALRGIDLAVTKKNLQLIIDKTKDKYPDVKIIITGMQVPSNWGIDYTKQFREMYPELAKTNDAALIPFLLEGVGGMPELNLPDRIHPTAAGHKIIAENVWKVLQPLLENG